MKNEVINGMSMDDYRAAPAVSASDLKNLKRSPAYARMRSNTSTKAQEWGTAVHTAILEPETLKTRYEIDPESPKGGYPQGWRNTKVYKQERELAFLDNPELVGLLTPQQFSDLEQIQRNVAKDEIGRKLRELEGERECSVFAHFEDFDLWLKCRPDWLVRPAKMVVDVKNARDATPRGFSRACAEYDYHMSAALYEDVLNKIEIDIEHYVFLVISPDAPFEIRTYTLDTDSIEQGRHEYRQGLGEWRECVELDAWPVGPGKLEEIRLPEYRITHHLEAAA